MLVTPPWRKLGVDHGRRLLGIDILRLADGGDLAVDGGERVGVQDRLPEIAREQQPDIADDKLAGAGAGGLRLGHDGYSPWTRIRGSARGDLDRVDELRPAR
jgi:hypothetical protein